MSFKKDNWERQQLQVVIALENFSAKINNIPAELGDDFDEPSLILPVPPDAPKEFPRLILNSSRKYRLQLSGERLDLFFSRADIPDTTIIYKVVRNVLAIIRPKINWIGIVSQIIQKTTTTQEAVDNVDKLINPSSNKLFPKKGPERMVHIQYQENNYDFPGNGKIFQGFKIVKINSDSIEKSTKERVNFIELDINTKRTKPESGFTYEPEDILSMMKHFETEEAGLLKELENIE